MNAGVFLKVKKYFAIFLMGVVGFLILNNALFLHLHTLPNGKVIAHAHPFSKTSQTDSSGSPINHQHTKVEFHLLDSLMLLFTIGIIVFAINKLFGHKVYFFAYIPALLSRRPQLLTNKAPPVLA
ncbi:MAG: hypothetical protein ACLFNU_11890 [Bacteroidales bacterium]